MQELVTNLIENFSENRRDYGRQLAELLEQDPASFQQAAVQYLSKGGTLPSEGIVVWLMQKAGMLLDVLLDPNVCSLDQALVLAHSFMKNADRIDVHLARALKDSNDEEASRILRLLAEIADSNRTLPLLTSVLREADAELRAKAALIFARHCQNALFIENALEDDDPKVRASAIEGMGLAKKTAQSKILAGASQDPDPHVRAHALLASHRLGDVRALGQLEEMARHAEVPFRASAAWAMGETLDSRCEATLKTLQKDPSEEVRSRAAEALQTIKRAEDESELGGPGKHAGPPLELAVDVLFAAVDESDRRTLYVSVVDPDQAPLTDILEKRFSVEEDDLSVSGIEVCTPKNREPFHIAYVLDRSGSISATRVLEMNAAVIRSLNEKQPADRLAVYKFSMDVERAIDFTENPRQITAAVQRTHSGLKTASRLHDAIGRALQDLQPLEGLRAVIAITDGPDRGSEDGLPAVIKNITESNLPLHMIAFGGGMGAARVRDFAQQAGGRFYMAADSRELTWQCCQILSSASNHYKISYVYAGRPARGICVKLKSPRGTGETTVLPAWAKS